MASVTTMRPIGAPPSSPSRACRLAVRAGAWLMLFVGGAAATPAAQGPADEGRTPEPPPAEEELSGAGITGADVLALVDLVRLEIEQLRLALDRAPLIEPPIEVRGATLRECTNHARFLHRRAARLALDLRHMRAPAPLEPRGTADHAHLWSFIDATLDRLGDARAALGLSAPIAPLPTDRQVDADELLAALLEAERAIYALAPGPPSYGELHFVVTRALGYASSLRATFPGRRMPPTPALEVVSSNDTVQDALRKCLRSLGELSRASGLPPLAFVPDVRIEGPTTRDLRTLAELIEAELGSLHARHGNPDLLPPVCEPGVRNCATVQQRCGALAAQLHTLQECLQGSPKAWVHGSAE